MKNDSVKTGIYLLVGAPARLRAEERPALYREKTFRAILKLGEGELGMLFDVHTHDARQRDGVLRLYNLKYEEWGSAERFASFSAGIHPMDLPDAKPADELFSELERALRKGASALGECGLDRRSKASLELQAEFFIRQAELAESLRIPVIVHCVRAFPELLAQKKRVAPSVPWIVHGFRGNAGTAREMLKHGVLLSFGSALLNAQDAFAGIFRGLPSGSFLLETDDAPYGLDGIYAAAARIRGEEPDELERAVESAARGSVFAPRP